MGIRKIIQIVAVPASPTGDGGAENIETLVALCDDGTLWKTNNFCHSLDGDDFVNSRWVRLAAPFADQ